MYYNVSEVRPLDGHKMELRFDDGKRGVFDMSGYLDMHIFKPLRSLALFRRAEAMDGTVVWPGDIDIAPERLYEDCEPA